MQEQPFTPDDEYCAYCHAPAAGVCADCGALCCGDCVEVVLRFTSHRAVCHACLRDATTAGASSAGRWARWSGIAIALAALVGGALWWLTRGS